MKLCHLNILWTLDAGVLQKLSHQARALHDAMEPHDQAEFIVVVRQEEINNIREDPFVTFLPITAPGPRLVKEALLPFLVWSKLRDRLIQYDAVVTRWPIPTHSFLNAIRRNTIFTEHHSKELEELAHTRGLKTLVRRRLEKRNAPRILRSAQGIIGVTDEIRRYELRRAKSHRPSLVLPNGVSLSDIPQKIPISIKDSSIEIAFLSSQFSPWHGLDRLFAGLKSWSNPSHTLTIHLIGRVSPEQKAEIQTTALEKHFRIHGVLYGEKLNQVLSGCHIAIGSLALHRNNLKEACVLKAREYTARGLPFVIAYNDPDFTSSISWVLKVPADDTPIDINILVDFARQVDKRPSLAIEMRRYAETRLSWSSKMRQLVDFVQHNIVLSKNPENRTDHRP